MDDVSSSCCLDFGGVVVGSVRVLSLVTNRVLIVRVEMTIAVVATPTETQFFLMVAINLDALEGIMLGKGFNMYL
jgi:hypothetical protein